MSRFLIAPSILSADFSRLADEVRAAEAAGADWLHLDVMDGRFVPNVSFGPDVVAAVAKVATRPLDAHLMVEEPERQVGAFIDAGATAVGVHVEACRHLHRTLERIRSAGARACVALNPSTPAEAIREVLPCVDQVLVMTVNPGFGGQAFIPDVMPKLYQIRRWIDLGGHDVDLVVDGGIGPETIEEAALNGGRVFVMGSAFFKSGGDYKQVSDEIRSRLEPYEEEPSA